MPITSKDIPNLEAPPTRPLSRLQNQSWRRTLLAGIISMVLASGIAIVVLRLWNADAGVTLSYRGGDAIGALQVITEVMRHGWWFQTSSVGWPLGQHLLDYPSYDGDQVQLAVIKLMGYVFHSPAVVENLYYLAGFPLIALETFCVMRWFSVRRSVASVFGALVAVLPYHFMRAENHFFLSGYFSIPICIWWASAALLHRPIFFRQGNARRRIRSVVTWRNALAVGAIIVVGGCGVYYAVFTAMIVGLATLIALTQRRSRKHALHVLVCLAATGVVLLINMAPALAYRHSHGVDPVVGVRQPQESALYGLKLTAMALPIGEKLTPAFLKNARLQYNATSAPDEPQGIGLVATLGFFGLLAATILLFTRSTIISRRVRAAAFIALVAFLIATVGGFGELFAYLVSPQIRGWNRISVLIGATGLLAMAFVIDHVMLRMERMRRHRIGVAAAFALLLVAGTYAAIDADATPGFVPAYTQQRDDWTSDRAFAATMVGESTRPIHIYELPYVPFPEAGGSNALQDYDLFRPYIQSDKIDISYGAMRGRPADWQSGVSQLPIAEQVRDAAAIGFNGIYVDTAGYADHGAAVLTQLTKTLHEQPITSLNGRQKYFSLASYTKHLNATYSHAQIQGIRATALYLGSPTFGSNFYGLEQNPGTTSSWHWMRQTGTITFHNPSNTPISGMIRFQAIATATTPTTLVVRAGSARKTFTIPPVATGQAVAVPITIEPHSNPRLHLASNAPVATPAPGDTRTDLVIRIANLSFTPTAIKSAHETATDAPSLKPVYGPSFYAAEHDANNRWRWMRSKGEITLYNPSSEPISGTAHFQAIPGAKKPTTFVAGFGTTRKTFTVPPRAAGASIALPVTIKPHGKVRLHLASNAPAATPTEGDTRNDLVIRIANFSFTTSTRNHAANTAT